MSITEQNRKLGFIDGQALCQHLGVSWGVVNCGLTLLTRVMLVAAPTPEAFDPAVRNGSAVISRKPLVDFGLANSAFAQQHRPV